MEDALWFTWSTQCTLGKGSSVLDCRFIQHPVYPEQTKNLRWWVSYTVSAWACDSLLRVCTHWVGTGLSSWYDFSCSCSLFAQASFAESLCLNFITKLLPYNGHLTFRPAVSSSLLVMTADCHCHFHSLCYYLLFSFSLTIGWLLEANSDLICSIEVTSAWLAGLWKQHVNIK